MSTYIKIIGLLTEINVITKKGQLNKQSQVILLKHPSILEQVLESTQFLIKADIRSRLYAIRNNISAQPTCTLCGNPTHFNRTKNKFNAYCPNIKGRSCASNEQSAIQRKKDTTVARYGVENASQSPEIRSKVVATNMQRFGGVAPMCSTVIQEKRRNTTLERYGVEYTAVLDFVKDKRMDTMLQKYNRHTFAQTQLSDDVYNKVTDAAWLEDQLKDLTKRDIAHNLGVSFNLINRHCNSFNLAAQVTKHSLTSLPQKNLVNFISSHYTGPIIQNDRDTIAPFHLDILLPELNLAIEYDGIFWHSERNGKDKNYHINKMRKCNERGIQLINIWSNEWETNSEIVKSRLLSKLKQNKIIYARKCSIVEITDSKLERVLMNKWHLQRYAPSSKCYGLIIEGEVVATMSFVKSRFNKAYDYELLRFCCANYINVVGGASRLLAHFFKVVGNVSLISYCDLRWGSGDVYEKMGFTKLKASQPNYYYFKRNTDVNKLYSRVQFQKHKLSNLLEVYDASMTEWENMENNNYDRIWDCGNGVYVIEKTSAVS